MSDSRRALVNQKLYFADLVSTQAAAAEAAARRALVQAALFHLQTAYRGYLGEIAATQRRDLDAPNARVASRILADLGVSSPELEELAMLEQSGGWPAALLNAYAEASAIAVSRPVQSTDELRLADITTHADVEDCKRWLAAFRALVETQRERFQEW